MFLNEEKEAGMRTAVSMSKKAVFLILCMAYVATAAYADQKAENIVKQYFAIEKPDDSHSIGTLVLIDRNGNRRTRKVEMYTKHTEHGENSYIEVLSPADVSGIRFLTIAREGEDEQRIFLPALGTSRRISGSGKKGRFLGSDIYYYDLEDYDFEEFRYEYVGENTFDGKPCDLIETVPKDPNDPYSRMIQWISKDDHFAYKVEMYHKSDPRKLLKTMLIIDVLKKEGVIMPTRMVVENHTDDHKTLLMYEDIRINVGIDEEIFTIRYLER
jgi:hypothetical protein